MSLPIFASLVVSAWVRRWQLSLAEEIEASYKNMLVLRAITQIEGKVSSPLPDFKNVISTMSLPIFASLVVSAWVLE